MFFLWQKGCCRVLPDACFGNQAGPESNRSHNTESSSTELPAWVITFSVLSYG